MLRKATHIAFIFGLLGLITAVGWSLQAQAAVIPISSPSTSAPLEVNATGSISGTITDSATGQPVRAASEVEAKHPLTGDTIAFSPVSTDGTYQIDGVPPGSYALYFSGGAPYYAHYYGGGLTLEEAELVTVTADSVTISNHTAVKGGTIEGTITDATTGGPLGIGDLYKVIVHDASANYEIVQSLWINPDGTYRAIGLTPGTYTLYFDADGRTGHTQYTAYPYHSVYYDGALNMEDATTITVTAESVTVANQALSIGGTIEGFIIDGVTGEPAKSSDLSTVHLVNLDTGKKHKIFDYLRENGSFVEKNGYYKYEKEWCLD